MIIQVQTLNPEAPLSLLIDNLKRTNHEVIINGLNENVIVLVTDNRNKHNDTRF